MRRMLRSLSHRENQDGFVAAVHNGSSEEWHRRCAEDEWFRPLRSNASPPRREERGYAESAPHAFVPWLAVHEANRCNRGVRSFRRVLGKDLLLPDNDLMGSHRTDR